MILPVNRQGKWKRGRQASAESEACSLSSGNGDVSKNQGSAAASAALSGALAGQCRSREATGLIGLVRQARRWLFTVWHGIVRIADSQSIRICPNRCGPRRFCGARLCEPQHVDCLVMLNLPRASCLAKLQRVTDSRSGARLCEPQHVESGRRAGCVKTLRGRQSSCGSQTRAPLVAAPPRCAVSPNCIRQSAGSVPRVGVSQRLPECNSVLRQSATLRYGGAPGPANSEFGIRHSAFRLRAGWTLIESIAVMAVIAILAGMAVPTIIRRVDRAAWTKETADLNAIGDAFTQSIFRTKTIPTFTNWAGAVASQMSLPVSAVLTNGRRYARAFLIDPNVDIEGVDLTTVPYTQTINGTYKPNNARVMIVSSLSGPLENGIRSAPQDVPTFQALWDTPEGGTPAGWTMSGDELRIKKINLESLFHQLILVKHDT